MRKVIFVFMFAALIAGAAYAQETTGEIRGTAVDPDGAALPGVTITAENNETGMDRTSITDAKGAFRFAALRPGAYTITSTLDGFQTHKSTVRVVLGGTSHVEVGMALGAITDVIEVTGEAPQVDVTSTVSGLTVGTDSINSKIPVVQDTQRIAMLAPSTVGGDSAFNGAGDGTYGQTLVSMSGASVAENSYQINGLNITNFRTGVGSSWVPMQFVEEVQVKTGGYEAEFGRSTGGVVNMVTKSGSNSFHGSLGVFYAPDSLQEQKADTYTAYNQLEESEVLDANLSLGGAIMKDKLFFFGFVQYRDTDYLVNSTTTAKRELGAEPYYGGKLDINFTPSHRVEATYLTDETSIEDNLYTIDDSSGTPVIGTDLLSSGERSRGGTNYIFKYTGIFTENFLLSGQYGVNNFDRTDSATGDVFPYAHNYTSGSYERFPGWTNWARGYAEDEREAYRIDADVYLGNHSLRGGIDYETNWSDDATEYSGGYRISYYLNDGRFEDLADDQMIVDYRVYNTQGDFNTYSNAVYLQDSWAVTPNLTMNLGVRWEQYENENINGETFIEIDDQYAPRLGVIWDPSGEGRSKLYGSYGKYHLPIASNTNIRMAGTELYTGDWFTVDGYQPDGAPINMDATNPLDDQRVYSDGNVPDIRQVADKNLRPMAQDEFIIGYEQMMGDDWSVGVRGVMREFSTVIEDIGGDWAMYDIEGIDIHAWWGILANPGENVTAYYDVDGDGVVEEYFFSAEDLDYPAAERKYYALEFTAKRRFADNWMLNLTYSWSHSYGNYEGFVDSTIGQSDGGITQLFDYPGLAENSYGNLPNDRRHNVKAFGVYAFDMGLQLGGNLYYTSGRPISAQGIYPDWDNWASDYGVASFFAGGEAAPRGSYGTTDDVYGFDAMVKYDFQVGNVDMNVRLDVFNLFDQGATTEVNESADLESDWNSPNTEFLSPTNYQAPRSVRFGFGLNF